MAADPAASARRERDWFATPPEIADMAAGSAFLAPGLTVLEPSAGEGALVRAAAQAGCLVDAVEADQRGPRCSARPARAGRSSKPTS